MWLLIDNYDSFTYILRDYLLQLQPQVRVIKNDAHELDEIIAMNPERIILSPGPKSPDKAGITMQVIHHFHDKIPILGVCLGHQALAQYFGARVLKAGYPMHGKTSLVNHNQEAIFKGLPTPLQVMRYHSLIIKDTEAAGLEVLGTTADGTIMAFRHRQYACTGVQFHPESILTVEGLALLRNWANNI